LDFLGVFKNFFSNASVYAGSSLIFLLVIECLTLLNRVLNHKRIDLQTTKQKISTMKKKISFEAFLETCNKLAEGFLADAVGNVNSKLLDLDSDGRAGDRLWVGKDFIACDGNDLSALNYYGGFEYVDEEFITKIGDYTFFGIDDEYESGCRVKESLQYWEEEGKNELFYSDPTPIEKQTIFKCQLIEVLEAKSPTWIANNNGKKEYGKVRYDISVAARDEEQALDSFRAHCNELIDTGKLEQEDGHIQWAFKQQVYGEVTEGGAA
jgi:hypothetical protein